jgi:hypothetical protein
LTAFVGLGGNNKPALRLESALIGILTVWGVYLLGCELLALPARLLAAWLTAASFWHLNFSRIATHAIGAPLFLVWGMYLLLAGIRHVRQGKPWIGLMGAAGLAYGLGFHTYLAYRITPLLIAAVLAHHLFHARKEPWRGALLKASGLFLAVTLLAVAPLLLSFLRTPRAASTRTTQVSVFRSAHPAADIVSNIGKTIAMFFVAGDADWRHNYNGDPEIFWPVAALLVVEIVVAAREAWRLPYTLVLAWLVAGAVPEVLSNEGIPHAYRAILMIPPVFLVAALGACWCYPRLARVAPAWVPVPLAAGVLLWVAWNGYQTYFDLWAADNHVARAFQADLIDIADELKYMPHYAEIRGLGQRW